MGALGTEAVLHSKEGAVALEKGVFAFEPGKRTRVRVQRARLEAPESVDLCGGQAEPPRLESQQQLKTKDEGGWGSRLGFFLLGQGLHSRRRDRG